MLTLSSSEPERNPADTIRSQNYFTLVMSTAERAVFLGRCSGTELGQVVKEVTRAVSSFDGQFDARDVCESLKVVKRQSFSPNLFVVHRDCFSSSVARRIDETVTAFDWLSPRVVFRCLWLGGIS